MRQHRNMFKMKEQHKTPEKELSEVAIGNLPEKEFRVKVMKELGRRMDAQSKKLQAFNKELGYIKHNQTETKNTITEMKKTLEGINSTLNDTEERISELEDRVVETTAAEQKKE